MTVRRSLDQQEEYRVRDEPPSHVLSIHWTDEEVVCACGWKPNLAAQLQPPFEDDGKQATAHLAEAALLARPVEQEPEIEQLQASARLAVEEWRGHSTNPKYSWAVVVGPPLQGARCELCGTGRMVGVYEYGTRLLLLDYRCAAIVLAELVGAVRPEEPPE